MVIVEMYVLSITFYYYYYWVLLLHFSEYASGKLPDVETAQEGYHDNTQRLRRQEDKHHRSQGGGDQQENDRLTDVLCHQPPEAAENSPQDEGKKAGSGAAIDQPVGQCGRGAPSSQHRGSQEQYSSRGPSSLHDRSFIEIGIEFCGKAQTEQIEKRKGLMGKEYLCTGAPVHECTELQPPPAHKLQLEQDHTFLRI